MKREVEAFASQVTRRLARELLESNGVLIAPDDELVIHDVLVDELERTREALMTTGDVRGLVEAFRRGLKGET